MGRLRHLQQSLPRLVRQPRSTCVVVDYACPEGSGDWVEENFPDVDVVRVRGERFFQPSRAKHLGAGRVQTEWLCLIDADILLEPNFCEALLPILRPGQFYRGPARGEGTFGTMICQTDAFHRVGGLDQQYEGWGDEDADLYDALRFEGIEQHFLPLELMRHVEHGNVERVKFYDVSCREESLTVNRIYRLAKWDLARLHERALSPSQCENLYRIVREKVRTVWQEGREDIVFDTRQIELQMGPWRLERQLVYRITR